MMLMHSEYWQHAMTFKWWRVMNLLKGKPSVRISLAGSDRRPLRLTLPYGSSHHPDQDFFFQNVDAQNIQLHWRGDVVEPWHGFYEVTFRFSSDAVRYKLSC